MDYSPSSENPASPRRYKQVARAQAAESTRGRILDAFADALRSGWMDDVTLDGVAATAGTTRQTVIRMFGGKEGLLRAVAERFAGEVAGRRSVPEQAGPAACVRALVQDYEVIGDSILRLLAQEGRYPVLSALLDVGRSGHEGWVASVFAPALDRRTGSERDAVLAQLVVATDVYAWKLLRRDRGLSASDTERLITSMVTKLAREDKQ